MNAERELPTGHDDPQHPNYVEPDLREVYATVGISLENVQKEAQRIARARGMRAWDEHVRQDFDRRRRNITDPDELRRFDRRNTLDNGKPMSDPSIPLSQLKAMRESVTAAHEQLTARDFSRAEHVLAVQAARARRDAEQENLQRHEERQRLHTCPVCGVTNAREMYESPIAQRVGQVRTVALPSGKSTAACAACALVIAHAVASLADTAHGKSRGQVVLELLGHDEPAPLDTPRLRLTGRRKG